MIFQDHRMSRYLLLHVDACFQQGHQNVYAVVYYVDQLEGCDGAFEAVETVAKTRTFMRIRMYTKTVTSGLTHHLHGPNPTQSLHCQIPILIAKTLSQVTEMVGGQNLVPRRPVHPKEFPET